MIVNRLKCRLLLHSIFVMMMIACLYHDYEEIGVIVLPAFDLCNGFDCVCHDSDEMELLVGVFVLSALDIFDDVDMMLILIMFFMIVKKWACLFFLHSIFVIIWIAFVIIVTKWACMCLINFIL